MEIIFAMSNKYKYLDINHYSCFNAANMPDFASIINNINIMNDIKAD